MTHFIEVEDVESDCRADNHRPGLTVRDDYGNQVETIYATSDGHFESPAGKIKAEDLGRYVLRITRHPGG